MRKRSRFVGAVHPKPLNGAVVSVLINVSTEELRDKLDPQQLKAFMQGLGEVIRYAPERPQPSEATGGEGKS